MRRHSLIAIFISVILYQNPLVLMAQFGVNGAVTTDFSGYWMRASKNLLQPNGKILTIGYDQNVANSAFAIAKYNLDGNLDTTFGGGGLVTTVIGDVSGACDVLRQSDGKTVVAGWSTLSGKKRFAIARYNSNGSLDPDFGNYGTTTTTIGTDEDVACAVIQQSDGKLVAAGYTKSGAVISIALVRYQPDGSIDTTFGTSGKAVTVIGSNSRVCSLIQQSSDKLVTAGYANGNLVIARHLDNGSLDASFGGGGTGYVTTALGSTEGIQQIIRQSDGKLVAVGCGLGKLAVARYSSEGILDTTFNGTGIVTTTIGTQAWGYGVVQQPDGMLVAAGQSYNSGTLQYSIALARYQTNGNLDASFGSGGIVTTLIGNQSGARSVIVQPDGKVIVSGYYNNGIVGFLLARYLSNGTLDTQDDPPLMTGIDKDHALVGQSVNLNIRGWNLGKVVAVQLRNSSESVNASGIVIDDARITASFALAVAPGQYDLFLGTNTTSRTFKGVFTVSANVASPVQWQVNNLGKAGTPITGPMGVDIGDVDGDGRPEIYIANGDNKIHRYEKSSAWSTTTLPVASAGFFYDVALLDMDSNGAKELYAANSFPRLHQYQWSGSSWSGNSFAAYSGPLVKADQTAGWLAEIYAVYGNDLMQTKMQHNCLYNATCLTSGSTILCGVSGDADNDQVTEAYIATNDHKIQQTWYRSYVNVFMRDVFSGSMDIECLAIGDLDRDGANELYGGDAGGAVRQFKWNGSSWNAQAIISVSTAINEIAMGDGDNDGFNELYACGLDGHLYQCFWNGSVLQSNDLANAGEPLVALAVGDGDGDGQCEVYGVGEDGDVYQFEAESIPSTPTPTPTVTPTITPTQPPWPDKAEVFCAPNPVRGKTAKLNIVTKQAAEVHVKIFTAQNQFVQSFDRHYSSAGRYIEEFYVGNLANGVYFALVTTRNADGGEDRVKYRFALIK